jgi:uncharacterized NAD(P)/FAD-binding protein YdhS
LCLFSGSESSQGPEAGEGTPPSQPTMKQRNTLDGLESFIQDIMDEEDFDLDAELYASRFLFSIYLSI